MGVRPYKPSQPALDGETECVRQAGGAQEPKGIVAEHVVRNGHQPPFP